MAIAYTSDKYLNIISAALLCGSFAFYVASFSSHSWAVGDSSDNEVAIGLWTTCYTDVSSSERVCISTESYIQDAWSDGWVAGTQGMLTLALIGQIAAMAALGMAFVPILETHPAPIFVGLCCTFAFVAWGWAGMIIFISRWSYDESFQHTRLSWCTTLALISLVLSMAALAFLFMKVMNTQHTAKRAKSSRKAQELSPTQPAIPTASARPDQAAAAQFPPCVTHGDGAPPLGTELFTVSRRRAQPVLGAGRGTSVDSERDREATSTRASASMFVASSARAYPSEQPRQ